MNKIFDDFLMKQLGDNEEVRFAYNFSELAELFNSLGIDIPFNEFSVKEAERTRMFLKSLIKDGTLNDTIQVGINELISSETHELTGVGFFVRRIED